MGNRGSGRLAWLKWWRLGRQLLKLRPKRACTDCGFLAYGDLEATREDRWLIHEEGELGSLPGKVEEWRCARNLWTWGIDYFRPNWEATLDEANRDRRGCRGFFRQIPGRTPAEHLELERESKRDSKEFRRKLWLGLIPLLGVALGVALGWFLRRSPN